MRRFMTFFLLASTSAVFAQKVVDTVVMYDGQESKERIEFDAKGQKIKETIFYKNGKIEYEHFFEDGKDMKRVNYDSAGVINANWTNPEIEKDRYKKERNIILILTGVFLLLLLGISWKFIGYKRTYMLIAFLAVLFPVGSLFFTSDLNKLGDITNLILVSLTLELPPLLVVLSIRNLNTHTGIPRIFSIVNLLMGIGLIIILFMGIMMAGVDGMIG